MKVKEITAPFLVSQEENFLPSWFHLELNRWNDDNTKVSFVPQRLSGIIPQMSKRCKSTLSWPLPSVKNNQHKIESPLFSLVNPTFLSRNTFYLQLSLHCPKIKKKQCAKAKKIHDFCQRDIESCHHAAARCVKLWSVNANLLFEEPQHWTKFA